MDLLSQLSESPMFLTKAGRRYLRTLYTMVDETGWQDDRFGTVVSLELTRTFSFFTTGVNTERQKNGWGFFFRNRVCMQCGGTQVCVCLCIRISEGVYWV